MNINIRPAIVTDADAIANILIASVKTLSSADYTDEQIAVIIDLHNAESYLEEIETGKIIILVAEIGTEIVGFGSISKHGRTIGDLYVLPNYSRQGIGTLLLNALEAISLEKRVSKLWVMAALNARSFYSACGFQYEKYSALIDSETGIKVPCVDMSKIIPRHRNLQDKNLENYEYLSTITLPQLASLGIKIFLGSSK